MLIREVDLLATVNDATTGDDSVDCIDWSKNVSAFVK